MLPFLDVREMGGSSVPRRGPLLELLSFSCSRCSIPGDHSDHFLVNIQHKGIKLSLERQTVCAIVASPQWHGALAFAAFDIESTLTANDAASSAHR